VFHEKYNKKYNKKGIPLDTGFRFPLDDESVDIINLFSVFSHTTESDTKIYLGNFHRILKANGKVFFTTFVEDDVPDVSINPENYRLKCSGPLHIVRYGKAYLFGLLGAMGYSVMDFSYATETDGQSAIYLGRK